MLIKSPTSVLLSLNSSRSVFHLTETFVTENSFYRPWTTADILVEPAVLPLTQHTS